MSLSASLSSAKDVVVSPIEVYFANRAGRIALLEQPLVMTELGTRLVKLHSLPPYLNGKARVTQTLVRDRQTGVFLTLKEGEHEERERKWAKIWQTAPGAVPVYFRGPDFTIEEYPPGVPLLSVLHLPPLNSPTGFYSTNTSNLFRIMAVTIQLLQLNIFLVRHNLVLNHWNHLVWDDVGQQLYISATMEMGDGDIHQLSNDVLKSWALVESGMFDLNILDLRPSDLPLVEEFGEYWRHLNQGLPRGQAAILKFLAPSITTLGGIVAKYPELAEYLTNPWPRFSLDEDPSWVSVVQSHVQLLNCVVRPLFYNICSKYSVSTDCIVTSLLNKWLLSNQRDETWFSYGPHSKPSLEALLYGLERFGFLRLDLRTILGHHALVITKIGTEWVQLQSYFKEATWTAYPVDPRDFCTRLITLFETQDRRLYEELFHTTVDVTIPSFFHASRELPTLDAYFSLRQPLALTKLNQAIDYGRQLQCSKVVCPSDCGGC